MSFFLVSRHDYTPPVNPVRFPACENQYCAEMEITNDNVLEKDESFTLSLMKSEGISNEIQLQPDVMEITIRDEDGTFIFCSIILT